MACGCAKRHTRLVDREARNWRERSGALRKVRELRRAGARLDFRRASFYEADEDAIIAVQIERQNALEVRWHEDDVRRKEPDVRTAQSHRHQGRQRHHRWRGRRRRCRPIRRPLGAGCAGGGCLSRRCSGRPHDQRHAGPRHGRRAAGARVGAHRVRRLAARTAQCREPRPSSARCQQLGQ